MQKKKIYIIIVIVLVAFVWIYSGVNKRKTEKSQKIGEGPKSFEQMKQKVLGFTIDGRSSKGSKQWHLEGKSAEIVGDEIYLKELTAVVYGEDNTVNLTSDTGVYRKEKGEVDLVGNVVVTADRGFKLTTDHATWSQITKEISTDAFVNIKQDTLSAVGKGAMADSDNRVAVLNEEVTVEIEPHTSVYCDGPLKVDGNKDVAVFQNNVKVVDKDGKLFADKLTVELDPETKNITRVIAEGNVKVKKGRSYTLSEKAIYTDSTGSAQLIGRPRIIIDPEEIQSFDKFTGTKRMSER
ncbi:MAG: LPS export ABC transporter periplasmic protein LptC [Candidatus Omnitrophica bacterium]|nr:LPS export ABC transporter periplasmic protein LptC [Candidatus Omnitrophota bacterium]